jgi:hypothetical protein
MPVVVPGSPADTNPGKHKHCPVCGRPVVTTAVVWASVRSQLWFHPACAADLAVRLSADASRAGRGRPPSSQPYRRKYG